MKLEMNESAESVCKWTLGAIVLLVALWVDARTGAPGFSCHTRPAVEARDE